MKFNTQLSENLLVRKCALFDEQKMVFLAAKFFGACPCYIAAAFLCC